MRVHELTQKINVIVPDVRTISGTVSRDGEVTADDDVFTSGSVRYINPVHLRPYLAARNAANRYCRLRGVRFLSGYAVADESLDSIASDMSEIGKDVAEKKAVLIANWDRYLNEWQDGHAEVAKWSYRFPSARHADQRIGFSVSIYKIHPAQVVMKGAEDGIASEIKGLAGRVLEEIAQDVRETWNPGTEKATQRIKGLLRCIAEKARTLSFLDGGRLGDLAKFVEDTIASMPPVGCIEGKNFLELSGLMSILVSPAKMAEGVLVIEEAPAIPAPAVKIDGVVKTTAVTAPPPVATEQPNTSYAW